MATTRHSIQLGLVLALFGLVLPGCGAKKPIQIQQKPKEEKKAKGPIVRLKKRIRAVAGVGKIGQSAKKHKTGIGAILTAPTKGFQAADGLIFAVCRKQIREYPLVHGHKLKSHEEFMKEVVQASNIKLPKLPRGQMYEFDPKEQDLFVVNDPNVKDDNDQEAK